MIKVYYSYDFDNDAARVQPITELNVVRSDKPISREEWKQIKLGGAGTIKKWINNNMLFCSCLVVLVGEETANRPLINYEIKVRPKTLDSELMNLRSITLRPN